VQETSTENPPIAEQLKQERKMGGVSRKFDRIIKLGIVGKMQFGGRPTSHGNVRCREDRLY
jgi:hypothetical protein